MCNLTKQRLLFVITLYHLHQTIFPPSSAAFFCAYLGSAIANIMSRVSTFYSHSYFYKNC